MKFGSFEGVIGVGDAIGVFVNHRVGVKVGVRVYVCVGVCEGVNVLLGVGVTLGVNVWVGVNVSVGGNVAVRVGARFAAVGTAVLSKSNVGIGVAVARVDANATTGEEVSLHAVNVKTANPNKHIRVAAFFMRTPTLFCFNCMSSLEIDFLIVTHNLP